jgi:hypothetical protein
MNTRPLLAALLLAALCLTGCVRRYTITLNNGNQITSRGKPQYDRATGTVNFTNARGEPDRLPAGSVRQISPASETRPEAGFNPQPVR